MILEGLVSTVDDEGSVHLVPMGPVFTDPAGTTFTLRPYEPSRTLDNLLRVGEGVLHVTDDVYLIANAALRFEPLRFTSRPARTVRGEIVDDVCRWMEFRVLTHRPGSPRHELDCEIVDEGEGRSFWGFNRARHAVLEATILATRVDLLEASLIRDELLRLGVCVDKTAGERERLAWERVTGWLESRLGRSAAEADGAGN